MILQTNIGRTKRVSIIQHRKKNADTIAAAVVLVGMAVD